jgi:hypothetical protein
MATFPRATPRLRGPADSFPHHQPEARRSGRAFGRFSTNRGITGLVTLAHEVEERVRDGRFQRWMALIAGFSGVLSGFEVTFEHYRGSYSRRIMYTPVILSGLLAVTGFASFKSRRIARHALPVVSALTLLDGAVGTYFHIRGIQRKPGGWRLPIVNIVMGPPLFAPLLFSTSGYLGLVAAFLRRDDQGPPLPVLADSTHVLTRVLGRNALRALQQDVREGRFQKQLALVTAISAFGSGLEAAYSHYKNNFRYKAQWTPIIVAPALMVASLGAIKSERYARHALPATSLLAMLDGALGFGYHVRGVLRRPGGRRLAWYNTIWGPPVFAPLLLAATGFMGIIASMLRRELVK